MDKPENLFFISQDYMLQYHQASDANKSSIPGHGYFAKLELFENTSVKRENFTYNTEKNA